MKSVVQAAIQYEGTAIAARPPLELTYLGADPELTALTIAPPLHHSSP